MPVLEKTKSGTPWLVQHDLASVDKKQIRACIFMWTFFFFIWIKMLCSILQKEAYNLRKMLILIKFKPKDRLMEWRF